VERQFSFGFVLSIIFQIVAFAFWDSTRHFLLHARIYWLHFSLSWNDLRPRTVHPI